MENSSIIYKIVILNLIVLSMYSCNKTKIYKDTPFIVVVKLLSAEQKLDYDEAIKYIDINKVYSEHPESKTPEEEWKKLLQFYYNLGKDPKFSNTIDFYKYDIEEVVKGKHATVFFTDKDAYSPIKKIIYKLDYIHNQWIVISIDYIKSN